MGEIKSVETIGKEKFVQAQLLRDVRKAVVHSGDNGDSQDKLGRASGKKNQTVELVSPLGFSETTTRDELKRQYCRLDGGKIKMGAWRNESGYLVCKFVNILWFAAYIPNEHKFGVKYPDGSGRVANKMEHERGDYVVCPSTPKYEPDMSRMYIVSNEWFHKMFRFTPETVKKAHEIIEQGILPRGEFTRQEQAEQSPWPENVGSKMDDFVENEETYETDDGFGGMPVEPKTPVRKAPEVRERTYPDIRKTIGVAAEQQTVTRTGGDARKLSRESGKPEALMTRLRRGSGTVEFMLVSQGRVVSVPMKRENIQEFCEKHIVALMTVKLRLVDSSGRFVGVQANYPDGSGTDDFSIKEAVTLARAGLFYNLSYRVQENGRGVLYGRNGTKLAELPSTEARM